MYRIGNIKDLKGVGFLLREMVSSRNKASHQFIGKVNISLKTIPLNGIGKWYPLQGRSNLTYSNKARGDIKLHLSLTASRPEQQFTLAESCSQYERVLLAVVEHELINDSKFCGHLPETAKLLMGQLAAHRGLRSVAVDVCTWSVLGGQTLNKKTLDFAILVSIINRIRKAFSSPNEVIDPLLDQMFWSAADGLVQSCLSIIRQLRNNAELLSNPSQLDALLEYKLKISTNYAVNNFANL